MTNDIEKKAGQSMMSDLIPGHKAKREAKELADARRATTSYYSNRDYGSRRYYDEPYYSRQGSLLDDDGPDPLDDSQRYGRGHSYSNRDTYVPPAPLTAAKKLERLSHDWVPGTSNGHAIIEQTRLDTVSNIISIEVGTLLDSADLAWGSESGNRLRDLLSRFILEECHAYVYGGADKGYRPLAVVDTDGVVHDGSTVEAETDPVS